MIILINMVHILLETYFIFVPQKNLSVTISYRVNWNFRQNFPIDNIIFTIPREICTFCNKSVIGKVHKYINDFIWNRKYSIEIKNTW